jgi:hypothetical protein
MGRVLPFCPADASIPINSGETIDRLWMVSGNITPNNHF